MIQNVVHLHHAQTTSYFWSAVARRQHLRHIRIFSLVWLYAISLMYIYVQYAKTKCFHSSSFSFYIFFLFPLLFCIRPYKMYVNINKYRKVICCLVQFIVPSCYCSYLLCAMFLLLCFCILMCHWSYFFVCNGFTILLCTFVLFLNCMCKSFGCRPRSVLFHFILTILTMPLPVNFHFS